MKPFAEKRYSNQRVECAHLSKAQIGRFAKTPFEKSVMAKAGLPCEISDFTRPRGNNVSARLQCLAKPLALQGCGKKAFGETVFLHSKKHFAEGRAQAGVEYLMISGFLLVAVVVFFVYSITSYNDAADFSKAKNVVGSLANTASQLSGLGDNSSLTIDLEFPEKIQSFKVSGKTISLFLNQPSGLREFYAEPRLDLNSVNLPLGSGFHKVKAGLSKGLVDFTEVQ